MDMLHAMRTFARVVECGSFAAAANALDISAAQVSRIVAELETSCRPACCTAPPGACA